MGVCLVLAVHAPNVAPLGLGAGAVNARNKRYPRHFHGNHGRRRYGLALCRACARATIKPTRDACLLIREGTHPSREFIPPEKMGDCRVEVRDKHGRLLTKVSYASQTDPPQISDGAGRSTTRS